MRVGFYLNGLIKVMTQESCDDDDDETGDLQKYDVSK